MAQTALDLGYSPDQINKIGNGGSLELPQTISSSSLAPVPSLNTPPKPQDPTNYAGIMSSLTPYITQAYAPSQADQQNSDVQNELTGIYGSITGQGGSVGSNGQIDTQGAMGGALDTAAQSLGYANNPALLNQLNDANNQLRSLQLEAQGIPLQMQQQATGRGITEGGLQPLQTAALRNNAIKALGVASIAQTLQGNVARAQDMAQKAVDAQFQPLQTKLNYLQNIYQLNKDTLERQDKRRADMLKLSLDERIRVLNNQREDYKTALAAMADAVAKNPGNQQAALAAQQAQQLDPTDPQYLLKVQALVAPFASDLAQRALDQRLKNAQIDASVASAESSRASTAKTLADMAAANAPINGNSSLATQAPYNKLTSAQKTQADATNNILNSLQSYRDLYDRLVKWSGSNIAGTDSAELASAYNSLIFQVAQAVGTGALQQADREVIQKMIPNPTTGVGGIDSISRLVSGGKEGGLKQIDSQIAEYKRRLSNYGLSATSLDQTSSTGSTYNGVTLPN